MILRQQVKFELSYELLCKEYAVSNIFILFKTCELCNLQYDSTLSYSAPDLEVKELKFQASCS